MSEPIFAYAQLNARVQPIDRGERYEDPLMEALKADGWAEVTGGGTMQRKDGEIEYCGIDIDMTDFEKAVPLICDTLAECGAPKGSVLQFQIEGEDHEVPFGFLEGLAIYFNGTELPDEVYKNNDINDIYDEMCDLLAERGEIQGYWNGPTETALYLYGYSAAEMKEMVAPLMAKNPLCDKARYEVITPVAED